MVHSATLDVCTRFPYAITLAVSATDDLEVFKRLPGSFRDILRRLIKKVSAKDGQQPIFCKRETLAEEVHCGIATVYRALKRFEAEGWLERDWRACVGLRGSESHITFTEQLCKLLQLPARSSRKTEAGADEPDLPEIPATEPPPLPACETVSAQAEVPAPEDLGLPISDDRSTSYQGLIQPLKEEQPVACDGPVDKAKSETPPPKTSVRFGKFAIPMDLAWLVEDKGMNPTGVLSLMKMASSVGQRLSDIVSQTTAPLKKLYGRGLYAYLRSLAKTDKDWAYLARKEREAEEDAAAKKAALSDLDRLLALAKASPEGLWFQERGGQRVFHVAGGGYTEGGLVYTRTGSGLDVRGMPRLWADFPAAIQKGLVMQCDPGTEPA